VENDNKKISRGDLLQKMALAPLAIGAFAALAAEADAAGLSPAAAGYVPVSKMAGKNCGNCALFIAPKSGKIGKCKAVSGPIAKAGYCNLYNPKK
jgi:hypothetical protein